MARPHMWSSTGALGLRSSFKGLSEANSRVQGFLKALLRVYQMLCQDMVCKIGTSLLTLSERGLEVLSRTLFNCNN